MKLASKKAAEEYLESLIRPTVFAQTPEELEANNPLDRVRTYLSLLGDPHTKFPSVQVSGTSGKGSSAYYIAHILAHAGYTTGLTMSPHLQRVNERFQINGQEIADDAFVTLSNKAKDAIEQMEAMPCGVPTFYEALMGMVFLYFAEEQVDIAVVEVGLEGKYDASNVLQPLVAVLTNIDLDHTEYLGDTVEKIAEEAVSIIKKCHFEPQVRNPIGSLALARDDRNQTVVTGVKQQSVRDIVKKKCQETGATMRLLGKDFYYERNASVPGELLFDYYSSNADVSLRASSTSAAISEVAESILNGSRLLHSVRNDNEGSTSPRSTAVAQGGHNDRDDRAIKDIRLSMIGDYQIENATIAIHTVEALEAYGFPVEEAAIRSALQTAKFPGRFEVVSFCHPECTRLADALSKRVSGSPTVKKETLKPSNAFALQGKQVQHDDCRTLILDGAHNPAKMQAFITALSFIYPNRKKIFVLSFKHNKDIRYMLEILLPHADEIVATKFRISTGYTAFSMDAEALYEDVRKLGYKDMDKVYVEATVDAAIEKAMNISVSKYHNSPSVIVVTGSLYLVGEAKNVLAAIGQEK